MRRAFVAVLVSSLAAGVLLVGQPTQAQPADPPSSTYTSVSPVRVLDTRNGTGTGANSPVGAGGTVTLDLASHVPATGTAVVLNVTGVAATANTFVTVFPGGANRPTASSLNLSPGDTRPNQVTVSLGANRTVSLYNNAGSVDLVVDLAGYYATGAGAKFTALPASRVLDTRQVGGAVGPGGTRVLDLAERIPASATAVTFNLTGTNATAATHVTAFPTGTAIPTASNLNLPAGDTRPNLVTVAVGASRQVSLYNNAGSIDLVVDLAGFYTPDYGAVFLPTNPTRVLDTRSTSPLGSGAVRPLGLTAQAPLTATGVVLNLTGVDPTASTYVAAWAGAEPVRGDGSALNLSAGQILANAAVVAFGSTRGIQLYNNNGSVHLVADLAGVFAVREPACVADCVLSWGDNASRRLGTAQAVATSPTPAPVVGLSGVRAIAGGGSYSAGYALLADRTVLAWGSNRSGQLGNGWRGYGSAVPAPVLGLTDITALSGSGRFALRADGTVWTWGTNLQGELGNGTYTDSTVPVEVVGLTDVVKIADNGPTVYALRANGTVWAWGANSVGQLGTGSSADASPVPVQVSGLTDVVTIGGGGAAGFAVRADGTAWAWGANTDGMLGTGQPACSPDPFDPCESRLPVRVPALDGATEIAAGGNGYAVLGDGSAWAWGRGEGGRLGNGVDCAQACGSRVPVRVSNLTDVTGIADFVGGGYALRADGTVWGWGNGRSGALGSGVSTYSTVPVQIAGLTGASAVAGSFSAGYALVPSP